MEALPNLFVVGAAKSGTTALYQYFKQHPDIFVPESVKELNYMAYSEGLPNYTGPGDQKHLIEKSVTNLADYTGYFHARKGQKIGADVSPSYLYYPQASRKIAELCPQAKIVIILRNPIECVFSMYSMMRREGREPCGSFRQAFQRSEERLAAGWEWAWDYQKGFLFSAKVNRYLEVFPRSQLFIRRYEDLNGSPDVFYAELTNFIGVEPMIDEPGKQRFNEAPRRRDRLAKHKVGRSILRMAKVFGKVLPQDMRDKLRKEILEKPAYVLGEEDRRLLVEHFSADIEKLGGLLHWDLSDWVKLEGKRKG